MFPNILRHLCLTLVVCFNIIRDSQSAVFIYHKAQAKALKDLDLKSLEGKWFGVFHRNPKNNGESCPQLDIRVGPNGNYVNVTERQGNTIKYQKKMEQNQYLKGKIEQIIQYPTYSIGIPWYITQVDPVLVVYQASFKDKSGDNWSVYSRTKTVDRDIVEFGAKDLIEAGAVADPKGNYGYHCRD